jgi:hypothetical protein
MAMRMKRHFKCATTLHLPRRAGWTESVVAQDVGPD